MSIAEEIKTLDLTRFESFRKVQMRVLETLQEDVYDNFETKLENDNIEDSDYFSLSVLLRELECLREIREVADEIFCDPEIMNTVTNTDILALLPWESEIEYRAIRYLVAAKCCQSLIKELYEQTKHENYNDCKRVLISLLIHAEKMNENSAAYKELKNIKGEHND